MAGPVLGSGKLGFSPCAEGLNSLTDTQNKQFSCEPPLEEVCMKGTGPGGRTEQAFRKTHDNMAPLNRYRLLSILEPRCKERSPSNL